MWQLSAAESRLAMKNNYNNDINYSNTLHRHYNEAFALETLLKAISDALEYDMAETDANNSKPGEQITINVAGKAIAFYIGGVQIDALYNFIQSIADENGYEVDYKNSTVLE